MADITAYSGIDMADIAKINGIEKASSGGGTASTTPTISVAEGLFGFTTVTVTNHSSFTNPNYQCSAAVGATTTIADSAVDHSLDTGSDSVSSVMTFTDQNASTGTRTVSVRAQEFGGNIQSAVATATYDIVGMTARYIRLRGVTASAICIGLWEHQLQIIGCSLNMTTHSFQLRQRLKVSELVFTQMVISLLIWL